MPEVPAIRTKVTAAQAWPALNDAFSAAGRVLSADEAAMLLALVWIETGRGDSMMNNNPGNITARDTSERKFWRPPWFRIDANSSPKMVALHERMLKNEAPRAFRAYDTLADGFADFASQIINRFPEVLEAAGGSALQMVDGLHVKYSKDYNAAHASTFEKLKASLAKELAIPLVEAPAPALPWPWLSDCTGFGNGGGAGE